MISRTIWQNRIWRVLDRVSVGDKKVRASTHPTGSCFSTPRRMAGNYGVWAMSFEVFSEFASHANEYVGEQCYSGDPIEGVPSDHSPYNEEQFQTFVLHYLVFDNNEHRPNLHSELLEELQDIRTESQFEQLMEIHDRMAAVNFLRPENLQNEFENLKRALAEAMDRGLT